MEKGLIFALKSRFDTIAHVDEESGIEFWYARELQKELGYQRWENFMIAIERAETACEKSKIECHNHFREVTKMVTIGSSAERGMAKWELGWIWKVDHAIYDMLPRRLELAEKLGGVWGKVRQEFEIFIKKKNRF